MIKNSDLILIAQDRALAWSYINEQFDKMPTVEKLNPRSSNTDIWRCRCGLTTYKSGVFNGNNNRTLRHVMPLVGWNDTKHVWVIKNSCGEIWGDKGFA